MAAAVSVAPENIELAISAFDAPVGLAGDRLKYLDGLRGLAAVGVAWFHLLTQNGGFDALSALPQSLSVVSVWGRFGVQLFFALSGFVLARTLLISRRITSVRDVGSYFIKRSIRLDPAYWVILLVYIALSPTLAYYLQDPAHWSKDALPHSGRDFLGNVLYFLPFISSHQIVPVVWTLILEVQLYMFFAGCLWLGTLIAHHFRLEETRARMSVLAVMALIGCLWPLGVLPYIWPWFWPHLNNFLLGTAACLLVHKALWALPFALLVALPHGVGAAIHHNSYTAAGLIAFMLLMAFHHINPLRELMQKAIFQHPGRWSYSTYLAHSIVGAVTIEALQFYWGGPPLAHLLYVIAGILMTFAFSEAIWRWVERPSIRLSKRIILKH